MNKNKKVDKIKYIDIDVDVLDESIFPYTYCKKNNGITLEKLYTVLEKTNLENVKILSFSEYAYILDCEKQGIKIIFDIIDKYIY